MNIQVPTEQIEAFCRKWKVREFALFGSVLRDDFRPDSDVDVLVTFEEGSRHSLFDIVDMKLELEELFGRDVDLVQKEGLVNPFRRQHILANHQVVYAA